MPRRTPPSRTVIVFVRHGLTPTTNQVLPGRAPGLHLADAGREQAEAVAAEIAKLKRVDAVYASPLERARETAAPIAKARGLRVRTERGLIECDFGEWTGKKLKDLNKKPEWSTVQTHPSGFRFPGGESFLEMQARMSSTITRLCERHPFGVIVAVSHADPIKTVVADAMGAHLDHFQRLNIAPCSVTPILYWSSGASVLGVNLRASGLDGAIPTPGPPPKSKPPAKTKAKARA